MLFTYITYTVAGALIAAAAIISAALVVGEIKSIQARKHDR